jgi:hypothetical protein
LRHFRSPVQSPPDFIPPPSPIRSRPPEQVIIPTCTSPSTLATSSSSKENREDAKTRPPRRQLRGKKVDITRQVVVESRSDSGAGPEVELILSEDLYNDYSREMSYSSDMIDSGAEDNDDPLAYRQGLDSYSPLPMDQENDMSVIPGDILQLPIAPCGPQDGG